MRESDAEVHPGADGRDRQLHPGAERDIDKPFLMPVEDVFSITGRGTVATGRSSAGSSRRAKRWRSWGWARRRRKTVVTGVEMFRKLLDEGRGGRQRGAVLLRGVDKDEIERGQVLAKGLDQPHTKFKARSTF